jgi:hypothetical protein
MIPECFPMCSQLPPLSTSCPTEDGHAGGDQPLLGLLRRLVADIHRQGGGEPPADWCGPGPNWWADDAYAYLELVISDAIDRDIDISVCGGGRVLIRVER